MADVQTDLTGVVEELRALRLTLVDRFGRPRAALGPASDGSTGLRLYDADDRLRVELALDDGGATNLKLHGPDGEVSAWLSVGRLGDPSLYLHGTSRHQEGVRGDVELSVDEHGRPTVSLHDRDGQPRALLGLDEQTGMATLSQTDAQGNSCVLLTEDAGGGHLLLFDHTGRLREVPTPPPVRHEPAETTAPAPPASPEATVWIAPAPSEIVAPIDPAPTVAVVSIPAPADEALDTLARRVRRLERGRGISAVAAVLLGALVGATGARLLPSLPDATPRPVPPPLAPASVPVVHAEEIILTDRHGEMRARLGVLPDGTPLLWMSDPESRSTVEMGALSGAGAVLRLSGGRSSIALDAPPADLPSVGAYDGNEILFQAPSHVARFLPRDVTP